MTSLFRTLVFALTLPSGVAAQAMAPPAPRLVSAQDTLAPPSPAPAFVQRTAVQSTKQVSLPSLLVDSSSLPRHAPHYALVGLGVGTTLGVIGGVIGSRYAGCGCSDTQKTLGFALWFGAIGAGTGALAGAAVGLIADMRGR